MNVIFLSEASREFLAASVYYDTQQSGLGERFEEEVDRAIHWIAHNPQTLRLRRGVYRRLNLRVFPYYIAYVVRNSTLWIVAVAHSRRRPEYWIKRTKDVIS